MALFEVEIATDSMSLTDSRRVNNQVLVDIFDGDLDVDDDVGLLQIRTSIDSISVSDSVSVSKVASLYASAVRAQGANKIRIDFTNNVFKDSPGTFPGSWALTEPESYEITPVSPGAAHVVVQSVTLPVGQTYPSYVILDVTEMTDAAQYALSLVGNIVSIDNEPAGAIPTYFYGVGDSPTVILVLAQSKNSVQVRFSEPLSVNSAVWDTSNYVFDNGLIVQEVTAVQGSIVTLKTSDQTPGQLYQLTVLGHLHIKVGDRLSLSEETLVNTHYVWLVESVSTADQITVSGSLAMSLGSDSVSLESDENIGLSIHVMAYDIVGVSDNTEAGEVLQEILFDGEQVLIDGEVIEI